MNEYLRGSEWRRWDLHVHTPGTNKNDQYEGTTIEERWDGFYRSILDYVGDGSDKVKSIVSIGITDYLSIENYKKRRGKPRLLSFFTVRRNNRRSQREDLPYHS